MKFLITHGRHDLHKKGDVIESDINLIKYYPDKFAIVSEDADEVTETEETPEETTEEVEETVEETEVEETETEEEVTEVENLRKRIAVHRGRGKYNVYELDVNDFMELDSHDQIDDVGDLIAEGLTKKEAHKLAN